MTGSKISLDDKYTVQKGRVFLTGTQALVRLPLQQSDADRACGLNTAGFISGYRGSPLGSYDSELTRQEALLSERNIVFRPGVNEDLAATSVWGTQQAEMTGDGLYDGVFAIWYGKGPGVDRSGDVFRHANLAGSSAKGGVLVLMGDDHTCESSTTCHQSEFALLDASMPVLSPSGIQELLDFGLIGWALSRYSGCWVGMKCVKDVADASATVEVDPERLTITEPADHALPPGGLNIRSPDTPHDQERRLHQHKLDAVRAFVRANGLNRVMIRPAQPRLGIVTHGKSYLDLLQAFDILGLSEQALANMGVGVYKVGCTWPLEAQGLMDFGRDYQTIVVIEEKRSLLEWQIKEILFGLARHPVIIGKKDEKGNRLFQEEMALNPMQIVFALGERIVQLAQGSADKLASRLSVLALQAESELPEEPLKRSFYFCAGCPHNRSTVVPDGSQAYAGIGCSWMAQAMDRNTQGYTHMGGEGLTWVGESLFSRRRHMFQNIGDGTYFHSGLLAIRAAVAANTPITYKILYNDAVAMTGGQAHDGALDPAAITRQVHAEGVGKIVVLTDEPGKYPAGTRWAPGVRIHHRDEINQIQEELRALPGVTVMVYDQTCAAEKRRRRKRKLMPTPEKRLFINDRVCEGCGDCSKKSNCVAVIPHETSLGRKRAIDQSACNQDYSCADGFCPSFISVYGGEIRRARPQSQPEFLSRPLAEPSLPRLGGPSHSILLAGMGGTGIITLGALLGMAAHIEGKACGLLDMAGLAQKGGSVWSHVQIAAESEGIRTYRIAPGGADAVIGCDMLVSASQATLAHARHAHTHFVVNLHQAMPGEFTRQPDLQFPGETLQENISKVVGTDHFAGLNATAWARQLFGDAIAANIIMLGFAYQRGLIPIRAQAIERAMELNGVAVEMNKQAFKAGRHLATATGPQRISAQPATHAPANLDSEIEFRQKFLIEYQNESYAQAYLTHVLKIRQWEQAHFGEKTDITQAVTHNLFKLMAFKDEYEVARLHSAPEFLKSLEETFEGDYRIKFNLAPPLLAHRRTPDGEPRKIEFGSWILPVFRVLARMKGLRGTKLDVFGYTRERKAERALLEKYRQLIDQILSNPGKINYPVAVELLNLPASIRGFGHIKAASQTRAMKRWDELSADLHKAEIIQISRVA